MTLGSTFTYAVIVAVIAWGAIVYRYGDDSKRDAREYSLPSPPKLEGPLSVNDRLKGVEYILKDKIEGPESIVVIGDSIYTGLLDGRIVQIKNDKIIKEMRLIKAKNCDGSYDAEARCGRPLGLRQISPNHLIVADAYLGIFKLDIQSGKSQHLVKAAEIINGERFAFFNDVEILDDDNILFTDSSSKYDRRRFMHVILEGVPNGRILKHTISTGKTEVLLDKLYFANGIQMHPDKKSFIFSECSMARVKRYWLESKKVETFAENLPGMPDNIRLAEDGTFWVGLAALRHSEKPSIVDKVGAYPQIRQLIIDAVPSSLLVRFHHLLKPPHCIIVQLNQKGDVISTLHDTTGTIISDVSQVTSANGYLYFGSFHSPYIAKFKL